MHLEVRILGENLGQKVPFMSNTFYAPKSASYRFFLGHFDACKSPEVNQR